MRERGTSFAPMPQPIRLDTPTLWRDYQLIDSGGFEKLERFGPHVLIRPEPQAVWQPHLPMAQWQRQAHARFEQLGSHAGRWQRLRDMPDQWGLDYRGQGYRLQFKLALTAFKHVGLFPEQAANWEFIVAQVRQLQALGQASPSVLNLFAYTGGATLAARAAGASVTHVDSVKQVVGWARENLERSGLEGVRWIVEDAFRFVQREVRRGARYHGILLDPPAFGHGAKGERWKLEDQIDSLLAELSQLLHPQGFVVFNCYSLGFSSLILEHLLRQRFEAVRGRSPARLELGELYLPAAEGGLPLPAGVYGRIRAAER